MFKDVVVPLSLDNNTTIYIYTTNSLGENNTEKITTKQSERQYLSRKSLILE